MITPDDNIHALKIYAPKNSASKVLRNVSMTTCRIIEKGRQLCPHNDFSASHKRRRIRKRFADETNETDAVELATAQDNFRVSTFLFCLDQLQSSLQQRKKAYSDLSGRFNFICRSWSNDLNEVLTGSSLKDDAARTAIELSTYYPDDLDVDFRGELLQFVDFVNADDEGQRPGTAEERLRILFERKLTSTFPNVTTALKIYLSIMASNCTAERSFSKMGIIKNFLRSTMGQCRLDALSLLSLEYDIVRRLDFDDVIDSLSVSKGRRKPF